MIHTYHISKIMAYITKYFFQVPLGILPKNEIKNEDMTEVLKHLHRYVPTKKNRSELLQMGFAGKAGSGCSCKLCKSV